MVRSAFGTKLIWLSYLRYFISFHQNSMLRAIIDTHTRQPSWTFVFNWNMNTGVPNFDTTCPLFSSRGASKAFVDNLLHPHQNILNPPSSPLRKTDLQIAQIDREMILCLLHQPHPILQRRQLQIIRHHQPRRKSTQLHEGEVLADAAERAHTEGGKSVFVLDFFFLGVPALGEEGVGGGVNGFVCWKGVS